ncbi:MAG: hypothetical protein P8174_07015 [Gemmatimonadota bacterium]
MAASKTKEWWKVVLGALMVLIGAAGCDWSTAPPKPPAEAHVQVTGAGPLLIITSKAFDRPYNDSTQGLSTVLYQADTITSSLPFDSTYAVAPADRFLVRVVNPDSVPRDMRLQVSFDGNTKYDHSATLNSTSVEFSSFF